MGCVATGAEIDRFRGHTDWISSVAFSPDGMRVVSGAEDYTVRLWDVAAGVETRRFEGHTTFVRSVAFSPDGTHVASGSTDRTIRLWDVATGVETRRFNGHASTVTSIAFSPDGTRMVSGATDGTVRLWRVAPDPLGADEPDEIIPDAIEISLYPNPAHSDVAIDYNLSRGGAVRLAVMDLLGRESAVLVDKVHSEGGYTTRFETSRLSPGVYFLVFRIDDVRVMRPMTVIR